MSSIVSKSFQERRDEVIEYCTALTNKQTDAEKELLHATLSSPSQGWYPGMVGAPEVLQLGKNFIGLIGARRCLDIGTFTGSSALAWATALPNDGLVLSMDVDHTALNAIGLPILEKYPDTRNKISRDKSIHATLFAFQGDTGWWSGKWDFAFIDADKGNYTNYYQKAMTLLRPGGVIIIDNALWRGSVCGDPEKFSDSAKAIDECNRFISSDPKSRSALLNLGDGTHLAFKI
ncbi:o-methyltransferase domain-containing protein [Ditylenchus destructor]|nr:o-methyltransferase domain-containing protein [Ditylenchus destructor]